MSLQYPNQMQPDIVQEIDNYI